MSFSFDMKITSRCSGRFYHSPHLYRNALNPAPSNCHVFCAHVNEATFVEYVVWRCPKVSPHCEDVKRNHAPQEAPNLLNSRPNGILRTGQIFNAPLCQRHKNLDISPNKIYPHPDFCAIILSTNFRRSRNLPERAMKERHPKVLQVKPPRDFGSSLEAFYFGTDPHGSEEQLKPFPRR